MFQNGYKNKACISDNGDFSKKSPAIYINFVFYEESCNFCENFYTYFRMVEKYSKFMRAMGFRSLLVIGAVFGCGLSPMYAGNGSSKTKKPFTPEEEIAAIQYNKSGQLRTDFTDNQKFVELLLKAYGENVESTKPFKDLHSAVEVYHAAFEELKTRLQGKWREIFGDGPSRFPWNGNSDGATDLWQEDDLRRDIPVALSLWNSGFGHICKTSIQCGDQFSYIFHVPNDNRAYVPNNSPAYLNQGAINSGKDKYKAYVLKFFNASKLSKCRKYLKLFFCAPVSQLLRDNAMKWSDKGEFRKEDLLLLLNLYADYYSLDSVVVYNRFDADDNSQEYVETMTKVGCDDNFARTTLTMVNMLVSCYSNYEKLSLENQKWLCSLLDNLDANYYVKESLHTYCIQSYDLLRGFFHSGGKIFGSGYSIKRIEGEGLRSVFNKVGKNPLPEATWLKFVNYAEKRLAVHHAILKAAAK